MKQPHFPQPSFFPCLDTQIEEHLSDTSLNVKKLLRLVGMSRTDLHRKLQGSVGMSATEYVRHARLLRAAALLKDEPGLSVCEVAEEVGFGSQGYFAKRFREAFGECPLAWRASVGCSV